MCAWGLLLWCVCVFVLVCVYHSRVCCLGMSNCLAWFVVGGVCVCVHVVCVSCLFVCWILLLCVC